MRANCTTTPNKRGRSDDSYGDDDYKATHFDDHESRKRSRVELISTSIQASEDGVDLLVSLVENNIVDEYAKKGLYRKLKIPSYGCSNEIRKFMDEIVEALRIHHLEFGSGILHLSREAVAAVELLTLSGDEHVEQKPLSDTDCGTLMDFDPNSLLASHLTGLFTYLNELRAVSEEMDFLEAASDAADMRRISIQTHHQKLCEWWGQRRTKAEGDLASALNDKRAAECALVVAASKAKIEGRNSLCDAVNEEGGWSIVSCQSNDSADQEVLFDVTQVGALIELCLKASLERGAGCDNVPLALVERYSIARDAVIRRCENLKCIKSEELILELCKLLGSATSDRVLQDIASRRQAAEEHDRNLLSRLSVAAKYDSDFISAFDTFVMFHFKRLHAASEKYVALQLELKELRDICPDDEAGEERRTLERRLREWEGVFELSSRVLRCGSEESSKIWLEMFRIRTVLSGNDFGHRLCAGLRATEIRLAGGVAEAEASILSSELQKLDISSSVAPVFRFFGAIHSSLGHIDPQCAHNESEGETDEAVDDELSSSNIIVGVGKKAVSPSEAVMENSGSASNVAMAIPESPGSTVATAWRAYKLKASVIDSCVKLEHAPPLSYGSNMGLDNCHYQDTLLSASLKAWTAAANVASRTVSAPRGACPQTEVSAAARQESAPDGECSSRLPVMGAILAAAAPAAQEVDSVTSYSGCSCVVV